MPSRPSQTQRPGTVFSAPLMGLSSPRADGRLWWTSPADSGNYLVDQTGRRVKCKRPVRSSVPPQRVRLKTLLLLFQPGKLTEAFKYFLQGMGYSEYAPTHTHPPLAVCSPHIYYKLVGIMCAVTDVMFCVRPRGTRAELTFPLFPTTFSQSRM